MPRRLKRSPFLCRCCAKHRVLVRLLNAVHLRCLRRRIDSETVEQPCWASNTHDVPLYLGYSRLCQMRAQHDDPAVKMWLQRPELMARGDEAWGYNLGDWDLAACWTPVSSLLLLESWGLISCPDRLMLGAAGGGLPELVRFARRRGPGNLDLAMTRAARSGHIAVMRMLRRWGARVSDDANAEDADSVDRAETERLLRRWRAQPREGSVAALSTAVRRALSLAPAVRAELAEIAAEERRLHEMEQEVVERRYRLERRRRAAICALNNNR